MNARDIRPATQPFVAVRHVPQRVDHLPGGSPVPRAEQPARLKRPNQLRGPVHRLAPAIDVIEPLGFCRIGGRGDFLPRLAALVAAMQLDAEMAVIERRIIRAVTRIMERQGHVVANEIAIGNAPAAPAALDREQALAR